MSRTGIGLLFALTAIFLLPVMASAQDEMAEIHEYQYDNAHSEVAFKVRHLAVSNVRGRFDDVAATIKMNPADVTTLWTEAVIQVASVDTENEKRDGDLMGDSFFAADSFPEIRFTSTEITDVADDGRFTLNGYLTIRDVRKPIALEAEMSGPVKVRDSERVGFSASGEIDRFEFGLSWDSIFEGGGLVVAETVKLQIDVEARRPLEETSN